VPMLAQTSVQAQIVQPMATSLAFGILFSTVITLILVPTLYVIGDDIARALGRGYHSSIPVAQQES
jgi:multidrug efflux pump subunit AcrB